MNAREEDTPINEWLSKTILEASPADEHYVADWHLQPVVGRPPLKQYVRLLWQRRHFILADSKAKAFSSSKNMFLGHVWLLLQPAFDIALYGLIFGVLLNTSRGIEHFIGYLVIGVIFFNFFTKALNGGASLIRANKNVIRAFPFPRATLALSLQLRNFIDAIPTMITVFIALPIVAGTTIISYTWFLAIPLILLQIPFCLGLVFIAARICFIIPDFTQLIRPASRAWFYGSCVFFSIDRFGEHPAVQMVMEFNPAYQFLFALRDTMLYNSIPAATTWLYLAGWSFGILFVGFIFFWRREVDYGRAEQ